MTRFWKHRYVIRTGNGQLILPKNILKIVSLCILSEVCNNLRIYDKITFDPCLDRKWIGTNNKTFIYRANSPKCSQFNSCAKSNPDIYLNGNHVLEICCDVALFFFPFNSLLISNRSVRLSF